MIITYDQIYKSLFSKEIEDYVPDGVAISHPVIGKHNDTIVDCFLLFSMSRDGSRYSAPTARIIIEPENKKLIEYSTSTDKPFLVHANTSLLFNNTSAENEELRAAESTYQEAYIDARRIAFRENVNSKDINVLSRYLLALKKVELSQLQPYLIELGADFFRWVKNKLLYRT